MALKFLNDGYFAAKVGIGIANPTAPLHIESADDALIRLKSTDNKAYISLADNDTTGYISSENSKLSLGANPGVNANHLNIDLSNNKVGIGTTSPSKKLHVKDTQYQLRLAGDNNYWNIGAGWTGYYDGSFLIGNNTGDKFFISSSGNVGIGTTSPSQKLHVVGNQYLDGDLDIKSPGVGNSITVLQSTSGNAVVNIGESAVGHGFLSLFELGVGDVIKFDANANSFINRGNVGIGTTAPSQKLHVVGNARVTGAYYDSNNSPGTANQVLVSTATGTDWVDASGSSIIGGPYLPLTAGSTKPLSGNLHFSASASYMFGGDDEILAGQDGSGYYYATGNGQDLTKPVFIGDNNAYIRFKSGNSERMRITNTGNVGIGTTSPSQKLEVNGAVLAGDYRGSAQIYLTSPDSWIFRSTGGSERMRITSAGNVGINTTSPLTKLQITAANASSPTANIFLDIDGSNTPGMGGQIIFGASTSGTLTDYIARIQGVRSALDNGSSDLHFQTTHVSTATGPTTKMTILSDGNVGIGTTAPNYVLDISKDNASILNLHRPNSSTAAASFLDFSFNTANATEAVYARIRSDVEVNTNSAQGGDLSFHTANAGTVGEVMRLTQEGKVGIGTNNPAKQLVVRGSAPWIRIEEDSASNKRLDLWVDPTSAIGYIGANQSAQQLSFQTASSDRIRILNNGNVGIGTTSPAYKLHVDGQVKIQSTNYEMLYLHQADANGGFIKFTNTDDTSGWYTGIAGTEKFIISRTADNSSPIITAQQNGDVGIGTDSPLGKLQINEYTVASQGNQNVHGELSVFANSGAESLFLGVKNAAYPNRGWAFNPVTSGVNSDLQIKEHGASGVRMTIKSGGNVGIGTTSPSHKLTIAGTTSHTSAKVSTTTANANFVVTTNNSNFALIGQGSSNRFDIWDSNAGATRLSVNSAGNVGIGTVSPTAGLHVVGTGLFTGLVSGITPVNAANFVTKAYVDGSGGGTGPFLPLAGGTMTGNVKFNDNVFVKFGNQPDFEIGHDASNSYITHSGVGNLIIQNTEDNADIIFKSDNGLGGVTEYFTVDGANEVVSFQKDSKHEDNVTANFGNASDLQIYHSSSNNISFITNSNAAGLRLQSNELRIFANNGSTIRADFNTAVKLYHNDIKKFETGIVSVGTATTAGGTLIDGWKTTTQANAINDTTIATTAYVNNKIGLIPAGLQFEGTWDASTGNPPSASPENGQFWIVSVAGSTSLSGITDWKVGDWAIYVVAGSGTDGWQKVDNSSVLDGSGTGQKVTKWNGSGTSNTLTDGPITFSGNNSTFAGNISVTGTTFLDGLVTIDHNLNIQNNGVLRMAGTEVISATRAISATTGTFTGDITSTGLTVDYTGNRTGDAGILVTNDANDWGIKVDKDGTADYGILSQTDGDNAIVVRNAAGTQKIQLQGDGDATFAGNVTSSGRLKSIGADADTNATAASDFGIALQNTSNTDGNFIPIDFFNSTGFVTARIGAQFDDAGDRDTDLYFCTRPNGGSLQERMRIAKDGIVTISGTVTATGGNISSSVSGGDSFLISTSASTTGRGFIKSIGDTGAVLFSAVYGSASTGSIFGTSLTRAAAIVTTSDTSVHPTSLLVGTFTGIPLIFGTNNVERLKIDSSGTATFAGKIIAGQGVQFTGGTIAAATTVLHTNNVVYARGGSGGMFLQNSDGSDGMFIANDHVRIETGSSERMRITSAGNVGIGTTSPSYKLTISGGGIQAGGVVTYSKLAGSLDTTGYAVAGITADANGNGSSCGFTFTCFGHTGGYQKIVYSCYNGAGTWYTKKVINEGTNQLDVVASANGSTITFTFKAISSTMHYTPRVTVEATGNNINSTYA